MEDNKKLLPFVNELPAVNDKYVVLLNESNAEKMHAGLVSLQPGEDVGSHSTNGNEELIIVIEGTGLIETEGIKSKIAKDQVAYNPPFTNHNVINNGKNVMKYIFVVSEV